MPILSSLKKSLSFSSTNKNAIRKQKELDTELDKLSISTSATLNPVKKSKWTNSFLSLSNRKPSNTLKTYKSDLNVSDEFKLESNRKKNKKKRSTSIVKFLKTKLFGFSKLVNFFSFIKFSNDLFCLNIFLRSWN